MIAVFIRTIALALIRHADRIAGPDRREWTRAMAAEVVQIKSDWRMLEFAIGCLAAIVAVRLRAKRYEPLIRYGLAICASVWAGGKIYLLIVLVRTGGGEMGGAPPGWLCALLAAAALSYAGSAIALTANRLVIFGFFLIAALATNAALFGLTQYQFLIAEFHPAIKITWLFAIIAEDYFMWTTILFGAGVVFVLKHFDNVRTYVSR